MFTQALKRAEVKNSGSFLVRKIQPLGRHKKTAGDKKLFKAAQPAGKLLQSFGKFIYKNGTYFTYHKILLNYLIFPHLKTRNLKRLAKIKNFTKNILL